MISVGGQRLKCAIIRVLVNHRGFYVARSASFIHARVPLNTTQSAVQQAAMQLDKNRSFVLHTGSGFRLIPTAKSALWAYVNRNCNQVTRDVVRPVVVTG